MVTRYEELLPSTLPLKQGQRAAERARDSRGTCARAPTFVRTCLTGNTRAGARAKLTHYDLLKYFPDGAFAEDQGIRAVDRDARAGAGAAQRAGRSAERIFVIGDTPHDIEARDARSTRARSRSRPAAIRSKSCRRTIPGVCSSSFRRPTNFCELDRGGPPEGGPYDGMRHFIRNFPTLWRATPPRAAVVSRAARRVSGLERGDWPRIGRSGNRLAARHRVVRAC